MEQDRISDLPDDVSGRILSFLTLKEAVGSVLLSRRWRRLNVCLNGSDFDFRNLFSNSFYYSNAPPSAIIKNNRRSLKIVDKILLRSSNIAIKKFSVEFSWTDFGFNRNSIQIILDKWINCLAKPTLALLDLTIRFHPGDGYFKFPLAMLASSLQVLSLDGFQLTSMSSLVDASSFSSLHSLTLKRILFEDGVLEKILKVSPLLKNLHFSLCVGIKTLKISGFLHLKNLQIEKCKGLQKIDIDAPTLEVLLLSPPKHMINIAIFPPCLRKLQFCEGWYDNFKTVFKFQGLQLPIDMFFHQFFTLCPLLQELDIDTCPILQTLQFSTTLYALKTLHLWRAKNMVKFEIIAPNLEKFYIRISKNVPVISLDASDKLEVTVYFSHNDFPHDQVAKFLGTFNHCRAIQFVCFDLRMIYVIDKELRNNLPSPIYGTKCLEFLFFINLTRRLSEFVDYMLWLSPQATNLMISVVGSSNHPTTKIVLECIYEKNGIDSEGGLCPCCKLVPVTCWRHCLKEVRIQEFLGDDADKENVKSFFLEQIENLKITETSFASDSIMHGGIYSFYNELFI